MAQRIVDLFKAVHIHDQQGQGLIGAAGSQDRLAQALIEQGPVGQVGQRIVQGQVGHRLFGALAVGQLLLRGGIEAGVFQGERGQLPEAGQQGDFVGANAAARLGKGQADHAHHLAARPQGDADNGVQPQRFPIRQVAAPMVIVVHRQRLAGRPDPARQSLAPLHPVANLAGEHPAPQARHHHLLDRVDHVEIAVGGADQRGGAGDNRFEQLRRIKLVDQAERGIVQRGQLFVLAAQALPRPACAR